MTIKEFFGFGTGEYSHGAPGDGFLSWQHLTFCTVFLAIAVFLGIFLGLRYKNKTEKEKNNVLIWSAIIIDGFEIAKIIIGSIQDPNFWKIAFPLFLCSIQLITIPLAAFTKGRIKEAALDFIFIFGVIGGVSGMYGQAVNFNAFPAFSWPNVVSAVTHNVACFASLYIGISGMASMKKNNILITFAILFGFGIAAYIANVLLDYNYMYLMHGAGTPYDIFYNMVNGNPIIYPLVVMLLFVLYILVYYAIFLCVRKKKELKSKI